MRIRKALDLGLYLVTDPTVMKTQSPQEVLEEAIQSGVRIVQLREKDCSSEDFLKLATKVLSILRYHKIPLIINDRVDTALQIGAEGVHLGQSDLAVSEARKLLGDQAIIGLSVENLSQVKQAESADVDYLGVSSIFPTTTKKNARSFWGIDGLKEARKFSSHKLVGIGGIDQSNAESVLRAGADGLAIVSAICAAPNPKLESARLKSIVERRPK